MKLSEVKTIGSGILRPEGVMALDDGSLYTADALGRCAHIHPDGRTEFFGTLGGLPNGICIDIDGSCIIANLGNGEVQSLNRNGSHVLLMTHAEGRRMPAPNFPYIDFQGRLWVTNSTELDNVDAAIQNPLPDGCVVLIEKGSQPRIVASGIYFANGITLDAKEEYVYVAQTMQANILRYKIMQDGSLGPAEIYGPSPLAEQGFPDGIAFDEAGNLWIAFPARNAVGYVTPDGEMVMYLDDPESWVLQAPANVCFGGKDRRTAFIGSLGGRSVPYFDVPWPGMRLVHQSK